MKVRQMMKRRQSAQWFWATNPLWSQFIGRPTLGKKKAVRGEPQDLSDWFFEGDK